MECAPGVHPVYTMQDKGWHGYHLEWFSVCLAHIPCLNLLQIQIMLIEKPVMLYYVNVQELLILFCPDNLVFII